MQEDFNDYIKYHKLNDQKNYDQNFDKQLITKPISLNFQNSLQQSKYQNQKQFHLFCSQIFPTQTSKFGLIFDEDLLKKKSQEIFEQNQNDTTLAQFKITFPLLFKIFGSSHELEGIQRKKMRVLIEEFIRVQKDKSENPLNEMEQFGNFLFQKIEENNFVDFKDIQTCVQAFKQQQKKLPKKLKKIYQVGSDLSNEITNVIYKSEKDIEEFIALKEKIKQCKIKPLNYEYFQRILERIQTKEENLKQFLEKSVKNFKEMKDISNQTKDITGGIFKKFQLIQKQFQHISKIISLIEEGKKKLYRSNFEKYKEFFEQHKIQSPKIFAVFEDDIKKLSDCQKEFEDIMNAEKEFDFYDIENLRARIINNSVYSNKLQTEIDLIHLNVYKYLKLKNNHTSLELLEENLQVCEEIQKFLPQYHAKELKHIKKSLQKLAKIKQKAFIDENVQMNIYEFLFGQNIQNLMTDQKLNEIECEIENLKDLSIYKDMIQNKNDFYKKLETYKTFQFDRLSNQDLIQIIEDLIQFKFYNEFLLTLKKELLQRVKAEYYFKVFFDKFTNYSYNPDLEILIKFIKIYSKDFNSVEESFEFLKNYLQYFHDQKFVDKFVELKNFFFSFCQEHKKISNKQDFQKYFENFQIAQQKFHFKNTFLSNSCQNKNLIKILKLLYQYQLHHDVINKRLESLQKKVYQYQTIDINFNDLYQILKCFENCKEKKTFITLAEVDEFDPIKNLNEYCQKLFRQMNEFKNKVKKAIYKFKTRQQSDPRHLKTFVYLDVFFIVQCMGIELFESNDLQQSLQKKTDSIKKLFDQKKTFRSVETLIQAIKNLNDTKFLKQLTIQRDMYLQFTQIVEKIQERISFKWKKSLIQKFFQKNKSLNHYIVKIKNNQINISLKKFVKQFQVDNLSVKTNPLIQNNKSELKNLVDLSQQPLKNQNQVYTLKKICICRSKYKDIDDSLFNSINCYEQFHTSCLNINLRIDQVYLCPICNYLQGKDDEIIDILLKRKIELQKFLTLSKCAIALEKFMVSQKIDFVMLYLKKTKKLLKKLKQYQNSNDLSVQKLHSFTSCYMGLPFRSHDIEKSLRKLYKLNSNQFIEFQFQ